MSERSIAVAAKPVVPALSPVQGGILQRKCDCGQHTMGGECEGCKKKKMPLQRKSTRAGLAIVPPIVHEVLRSSGQPLGTATRAFMGPKFQHDFSHVRVHTDSRAAASARAVNALAYTVGQNVVLDTGKFALRSRPGMQTLAHELTHVIQQDAHVVESPQESELVIRSPEDSHEEAAEWNGAHILTAQPARALRLGLVPQVQRQSQQPKPAPFSVDQAAYSRMMSQAVNQMSGRFVTAQTMAGMVVPILQAMLAQVTWRDAGGVDHGGGPIQYPAPGAPSRMLNLRMILDDQIDPPDAGKFRPTGSADGVIEIRVRKNPTAEELALTMYHESMHLMSWLINKPGGAQSQGVRSPEARALDLSRFRTQIASIRNALEQLAQSVNSKRAPGQTVTGPMLDRMAPWLMEEIQVRAETEVLRLALSVQQARASRASVIIGTTSGQSSEVSPSMIDHYVFDFSHAFSPGDRVGLTAQDKDVLRVLTGILEGFYQLQVRRQFSLTAFTTSVERSAFVYTPPPLQPPQFRPLPLP